MQIWPSPILKDYIMSLQQYCIIMSIYEKLIEITNM